MSTPDFAMLTPDDLVTGEAVALDLPPATVGARMGSGLIDVALLNRGFHVVYMTVGNTFGCPSATVPLIVTKSVSRSAVHRRGHMDYIGVKTFTPDGAFVGERRFVGLFTSSAYSAQARSIPQEPASPTAARPIAPASSIHGTTAWRAWPASRPSGRPVERRRGCCWSPQSARPHLW